MYTSEIQLRVRYAETDQMGVVYHGNYFPYFEVARVEAIRQLGMSYADMEKAGVILPVIDLQCRYLRPAKYDELLTVKAILKELPHSHKIEFHHEVYNEKQELLASARILLYFLEAKTMKRTTMPDMLLKKLEPYFA